MLILLLVIILGGLLLAGSLFGGRRDSRPQSRAAVGGDKPNFLVFLVDDLDMHTMQVMLDAGLLPNIKSKIVDHAVDFQNAIVPCSICSPRGPLC
ncbi:MAG: hypothetical protein R3C44_04590 [Chloroflexota bacterium]